MVLRGWEEEEGGKRRREEYEQSVTSSTDHLLSQPVPTEKNYHIMQELPSSSSDSQPGKLAGHVQ